MPNHPCLQTALVTGATGFVGSYLVRRLVAEGWCVHILVLPQQMSGLGPIESLRDKLLVHPYEGATEGMFSIMEAARPDIVFHLASLFLSGHNPTDILPLIQSNVTLGTQLLEAMTARNSFRLVNTGTSWQHYESKAYSPVNLYAATKQAFEDILQYYAESTPLRAITLKLFDTYGPDDPRPKLFHLLRAVAGSNQPLDMSFGEQLLDLVYIDDVIDAFMLAARRLESMPASSHESYAVSSGRPLPLKEVVACYERVTGRHLAIRWGGRPYRPREVMAPWTGPALPGWKPACSMIEGIRLTEHING